MKLKLRIMNVLYFLISAAAIFFLISSPMCKMTFAVHIDNETLEETLEPDAFDIYGITNEDVLAVEPEINTKIEVNVGLLDFFYLYTNDSKVFVNEKLLAPAIEAVEDELKPALEKVAQSNVKKMIGNVFEKQLKQLVDGGDLYAKLAEKSYDKTDVEKSVDDIVDVIFDENIGGVNQIYEAFTDEYNVYADAFGEEQKTFDYMKPKLQSYLIEFGIIDEDGYVGDANSAIESILTTILSINGVDAEEDVEEEFDVEEESEASKFAQAIYNAIDKSLLNKEDNGSFRTIVTFVIIGFFLMLAFLAGWILKIVKLFICLFRKTPYLRISPYGIVTGIIQVLFSAVSIASMVLFTAMPEYSRIFLRLFVANPYPGFDVQMVFGAMIPGLFVIANALLSIVYNPVKEIFKKETKKDAESYVDIE